MKKKTYIGLRRLVELIIPAVLLSVLYAALVEYRIIKTVPPGQPGAVLMYYVPLAFAVIFLAGNAVLMRINRRLFIRISRSGSDGAENPDKKPEVKISDDSKSYYIINTVAVAVFSIFPFIARVAFDSTVYKWFFGITNCFRLAAAGIKYEYSDFFPVHASIALFSLCLFALIPLSQLGVKKRMKKKLKNKAEERTQRLADAEEAAKQHRDSYISAGPVDIYSARHYKEKSETLTGARAQEQRKAEEESRRIRENMSAERLDIYNVDLYDDTPAEQLEAAKKLRERGAKEHFDIYSMAAHNSRKDDLTEAERAAEEESQRLRERGAQERSTVDIYGMVRERDRKRQEEAEEN